MTETIVLGAGCFWCTEAVFSQVRGVVSVESGYCNGAVAAPTYAQVCTGETGCVEVVRVAFDPRVIELTQLLEIFFIIHDPTTLNRQGHDVGTQYRSGIYYEHPEHRDVAVNWLHKITSEGLFDEPITTEVQALASYTTAEAYHQNYFANHPNQGYCAAVVRPKVAKFQKTFKNFLK